MFRRAEMASAVAGLSVGVSALMAQAPSSAQVWDVQFVPDQSGPYAEGPNASQVGITMYGRVGILPNTSASGTNNLGVSRVGGAGTFTSGFRMIFSDPRAASLGLAQGFVGQGMTSDVDGRELFDTNGQPLRGHLSPFRGAFSPQVSPMFLGSNNDEANGRFANSAPGTPALFNLVGSRQFNFGSEGTGPVGNAIATDANPDNLIGDRTPIYRLYYTPSADPAVDGERQVRVNVMGMSGRYVFSVLNGNGSIGPNTAVPDQQFTFTVPTPGAGAAMLMLAGMVLRRRR